MFELKKGWTKSEIHNMKITFLEACLLGNMNKKKKEKDHIIFLSYRTKNKQIFTLNRTKFHP